MNDFASAVMVRVMAEGMRELGLELPPGGVPAAGGDARVALDVKRALVAAAMAQGGASVLPRLGRGLHRLDDEPVREAFGSARGAADLFARWSRLERYVHSRHRVVVEQCDESPAGGRAVLHHTAHPAPPPQAGEDLVVLGVLAALLESLGLHDVRARIGDAEVLPHADAAGLDAAVRASRTGRWTLDWRGARDEATDTAPPTRDHGLPQAPTWPDVARDVARFLTPDLTRPPTVAALAARMAWSTRSLQRALAAAGLSYSAVLAQTRCRTAAWWLVHSRAAVAEVGFVCGYADQPCFTREFHRRVGLPPAAFRHAFGGAGARPRRA